MKGLTHFMSGAAFGTFFEAAVHQAQTDQSFMLVLGGAFGILPDTLDFKFARFLERFTFDIDPHPNDPNPQAIADGVAAAITAAHEANGRMVTLALHSMQLSSDRYVRYTLTYENGGREVVIRIGPHISRSKVPYPGTEPPDGPARVGRATLPCRVRQDYEDETVIDTFSGPDFGFVRNAAGDVEVHFIPWHRRWSHSLTLGVACGLVVFLLAGLFWGFANAWLYGVIAGGGFCVHVIEDQFGHMGSNLFYPFTRWRSRGLKLMHSGDAWPNFFFVWLSVVLIVWNLSRFHLTFDGDTGSWLAEPVLSVPFWMYFLVAFAGPLALFYLIGILLAPRVPGPRKRIARGPFFTRAGIEIGAVAVLALTLGVALAAAGVAAPWGYALAFGLVGLVVDIVLLVGRWRRNRPEAEALVREEELAAEAEDAFES